MFTVIRFLFFFAIIIFLLFVPSNFSSWMHLLSSKPQTVSLTNEELTWLAKNQPIRIAFDANSPPYSFLNKFGHITGISYDTIRLISQKLNFQMIVDWRTSNKEIDQAITDNKIHVVANMDNALHKHSFTTTSPYLSDTLLIVINQSNQKIKNKTALAGKTIALVKNKRYSQRIVSDFAKMTPLYVKNVHSALIAVKTHRANAAIIPFTTTYYSQDKALLSHFKFVGFYDHHSLEKAIAVRNDRPILARIFQKGLDSISEQEKQSINKKWIPAFESSFKYEKIDSLFISLLQLLLTFLLWVWLIKYRNHQGKMPKKDLLTVEQDFAENHAGQIIPKSEEKYRSLVENLQEKYFFYQHDNNGIYTYLSPSVTKILGYKVNEFLKHYSTFQTSHPDNANVRKYTERCLQGEKIPAYEVELFDNHGEKRCLELLESPLYDKNKQCIGVEGIAHDITPLKKTQEKLNWLSYYDDLTGLANRRLFKNQVEQSIAVSFRSKESMAILFMDLDRFKIVNDSLGHAAGDEVLKETAQRLQSQLRDSDFAARMGGDEFTVILPSCDKEAVKIVAIKILHSLLAPYILKGHQFNLGASIGISIYPQDGTDSKTLLQQADSAMFHAKKEKLGYAFCSSDIHEVNNRRLVIEQALRQALERNCYDNTSELKVFFQKKQSVQNNLIVGFEALIRWEHPELGKVSPDEFIPIAEETGLIVELSRWIITRVCMHTSGWFEQGFYFGKIAINISAVELINFELARNIIDQIDATNAQRDWFEIEITETALMKMPDVAIEVMQQLVDAGLLIAIDDFGTGYSSLSYLKNIPASYIKIDQSFIRNVISSSEDQAVVQAIIALSHALGKKVIAEGVETKEQLNYLKKNGCDIVQGYWFSKPISAEALTLEMDQKVDQFKIA